MKILFYIACLTINPNVLGSEAALAKQDPLIAVGVVEMQSPSIKAILQQIASTKQMRPVLKTTLDFSDNESTGHPSPHSPLPPLSPRFVRK